MHNKSTPKFKKVIYKRPNNNEKIISYNIPLIHINLSIKRKNKTKNKNENQKNISQTLKKKKLKL